MKELQIMKVVFDAHIAAHETPAFRGAIISKVGLDRDIYHNHDNNADSTKRYHYRYPLIQYRQDHRRPAMVFIEEGIPEARFLFAQPDWSLTFAGRTQAMNISDMQVRRYSFGVTPHHRYYMLYRWQALNESNFKEYMATESLADRLAQLQKILSGHIISFAKGVDYRIEERFDLAITDLVHTRTVRYEGVKVLAFDVRIKTNLLLPPHIALGKGVSLGFGEVREWMEDQRIKNNHHSLYER